MSLSNSSYGDEWFVAREKALGVIPNEKHFEEANEWLEEFKENAIEHCQGWEGDVKCRDKQYEVMLKEVLEKDRRLRAAFPDNVEDVPDAIAIGTARFSARSSLQSVEFLQENGACLDNIIVGTSTIPQAGQGAFASRTIRKGTTITTAPVITLEREQLLLWDTIDDGNETHFNHVGHQLLLNYCYGHEESSLIFFPYSPSVNFINHGIADEANAEIRWSTFPYHKSEWLNGTLQEAKDRTSTGLLFDIVATKNIRRGEEVLLYYGHDWEEKWNQHVQGWGMTNFTHYNHGIPTTTDYNHAGKDEQVRTHEEQKTNPYPEHIMTKCHFDPPENCSPSKESHDGIKCRSRWVLTFQELELHPCIIQSRQSFEGMDWYNATVEIGGSANATRYLVEYVPRYAIKFVDRPYTRDQYAKGAFRQLIGLGDDLLPDHWKDLRKKKDEA